MHTKRIPGAIYSDITLEGDFGGMITGIGVSLNREDGVVDFSLPVFNGKSEDLLFFRLHRFANIFYAGKGNSSGKIWFWNTLKGEYKDLGLGFGNSPVAFWKGFIYIVRDKNTCDVINLNDGSLNKTIKDTIETQGIRYIKDDGSPVWGDPTYDGSKTIGVAQYTTLGNVTLGQSYIDGLIAVKDGKHKVVSPGPHEFIRAYRVSDSFVVSSVFLPKHEANFFWFGLNEIDSFPPETNEIPPEDKPVDKLEAPNLLHLVQEVISEHPEVHRGDEDERGKIVDYFCKKANGIDRSGSVITKPWGRKARNSDGTNQNTDGAVYLRADGKHEIYDIMDGNPPFNATWQGDLGKNSAGPFSPGENGFWWPISLSDNPPDDNGDDEESSGLEARVEELEDKLREALEIIELLQESCLRDGDKVSIRSESGHYLCAEAGGKQESQVNRSVREPGNANFTRDGAGGWETHTINKR